MNNLKFGITLGLFISFVALVLVSIIIGDYAMRIFGVLLVVGLLLLLIINLIQAIINFNHKRL